MLMPRSARGLWDFREQRLYCIDSLGAKVRFCDASGHGQQAGIEGNGGITRPEPERALSEVGEDDRVVGYR